MVASEAESEVEWCSLPKNTVACGGAFGCTAEQTGENMREFYVPAVGGRGISEKLCARRPNGMDDARANGKSDTEEEVDGDMERQQMRVRGAGNAERAVVPRLFGPPKPVMRYAERYAASVESTLVHGGDVHERDDDVDEDAEEEDEDEEDNTGMDSGGMSILDENVRLQVPRTKVTSRSLGASSSSSLAVVQTRGADSDLSVLLRPLLPSAPETRVMLNVSQLRSALDAVLGILRRKTDKMRRLRRKYGDTRADLGRLTQQHNAAKADIELLTKGKLEDGSLNTLRGKQLRLAADKHAAKEREVRELELEVLALEGKMEDLTIVRAEETRAMKVEQEKLALEAAECRLLAQARARQHRDEEKDKTDLTAKLRALEQSCVELRSARDASAAERDRDRAAREVAKRALDTKVNELGACMHDLKVLRDAKAAVEEQFASAVAHVEMLETRMAEMEKAPTTATGESYTAQYEEEIRRLREDNDSALTMLETQLRDAKAACAALESEKSIAEDEAAALRAMLEASFPVSSAEHSPAQDNAMTPDAAFATHMEMDDSAMLAPSSPFVTRDHKGNSSSSSRMSSPSAALVQLSAETPIGAAAAAAVKRGNADSHMGTPHGGKDLHSSDESMVDDFAFATPDAREARPRLVSPPTSSRLSLRSEGEEAHVDDDMMMMASVGVNVDTAIDEEAIAGTKLIRAAAARKLDMDPRADVATPHRDSVATRDVLIQVDEVVDVDSHLLEREKLLNHASQEISDLRDLNSRLESRCRNLSDEHASLKTAFEERCGKMRTDFQAEYDRAKAAFAEESKRLEVSLKEEMETRVSAVKADAEVDVMAAEMAAATAEAHLREMQAFVKDQQQQQEQQQATERPVTPVKPDTTSTASMCTVLVPKLVTDACVGRSQESISTYPPPAALVSKSTQAAGATALVDVGLNVDVPVENASVQIAVDVTDVATSVQSGDGMRFAVTHAEDLLATRSIDDKKDAITGWENDEKGLSGANEPPLHVNHDNDEGHGDRVVDEMTPTGLEAGHLSPIAVSSEQPERAMDVRQRDIPDNNRYSGDFDNETDFLEPPSEDGMDVLDTRSRMADGEELLGDRVDTTIDARAMEQDSQTSCDILTVVRASEHFASLSSDANVDDDDSMCRMDFDVDDAAADEDATNAAAPVASSNVPSVEVARVSPSSVVNGMPDRSSGTAERWDTKLPAKVPRNVVAAGLRITKSIPASHDKRPGTAAKRNALVSTTAAAPLAPSSSSSSAVTAKKKKKISSTTTTTTSSVRRPASAKDAEISEKRAQTTASRSRSSAKRSESGTPFAKVVDDFAQEQQPCDALLTRSITRTVPASAAAPAAMLSVRYRDTVNANKMSLRDYDVLDIDVEASTTNMSVPHSRTGTEIVSAVAAEEAKSALLSRSPTRAATSRWMVVETDGESGSIFDHDAGTTKSDTSVTVASDYGSRYNTRSDVHAGTSAHSGVTRSGDEAAQRASWVMGHDSIASMLSSYQSSHYHTFESREHVEQRDDMSQQSRGRRIRADLPSSATYHLGSGSTAKSKRGIGSKTLLSSQYHKEKSQLQEMAARREVQKAMAAKLQMNHYRHGVGRSAGNGSGAARIRQARSNRIPTTMTTNAASAHPSMVATENSRAGRVRKIDVFSGTSFEARHIGIEQHHPLHRRMVNHLY